MKKRLILIFGICFFLGLGIFAGTSYRASADTTESYQDEIDAAKAAKEQLEKERAELAGDFCRGCGYCMPCPAGIEINTCARMSLLLRRSPAAGHLSERGQAMMAKIDDCLNCGQCSSRCPYGLDTPSLLKRNYDDYKTFLK